MCLAKHNSSFSNRIETYYLESVYRCSFSPKSDVPNWCSWLLFVWVIVHIVVEIVLEIHYCCTFSQLQGNLHEKNLDYDRINKIPIKNANPPGYRWKPTLLFFYAIFTALVVSALVIAILLLDA